MWKYFLKAGNGNMKAVYEMPKVSFEAFMANNAVSACGYKFDCVRHGNKKNYDGYKDHGVQVSDCEPTSVISTYLGMGGCTNNAGFAVLNGKQNSITGGQTWVVTGLDDDIHDEDNAHIMESTYGKNNTNLLGWLFISLTGTNGEYNTSGWHVNDDDDDDDGTLDFKKPKSMLDGWHAWLTPVFKGTSTSGMGC